MPTRRRSGARGGRSGAWLVHFSTDYVFDGSGDGPGRGGGTLAAECLWPHQARRRARHSGQRLQTPDPAHQLGLFGAGQQLCAHRAAPGCNARSAGSGRRPSGCTDRGRTAGRHYGARCALRACSTRTLGGTYHAAASGETSWHGYACHVIEFARASGQALRVSAESVVPVPSSAFPRAARRPLNSRLDCSKTTTTVRPGTSHTGTLAWIACCSKCSAANGRLPIWTYELDTAAH